MTAYGSTSLARQCQLYAQEAFRCLDELRATMQSEPGHEAAHDEQLARFYVYTYLHRRPRLDSHATLIGELDWLRDHPPPETIGAFDRDHFERCRRRCLDELPTLDRTHE